MRTGTVTYRLDDLKKVIIPLGLVGENEFTHVYIDAGDLFAKYPAALVSMSVQPPKGTKYPVVVTRDGNMIEWVVKASDLVNKGKGEFQLTFTENNVVIRSYVGKTNIERSLPGSDGPAPDPITDFVEAAGETLAEVQEALTAIPEAIADALETAKESGEFDGADGVGISSIVKTETSGLIDTYTITLTNGNTYTFTVTNGKDGEDGDDGVGIQSIAKTGTSGLVDTYTITLTNNQQYTFTVTNGKDGDPTELIDDTAGEGDTEKTWRADKLADMAGDVSKTKSALLDKQDAPETAGTAGQILELDSNLAPVWADKDKVVNVSGSTPSITGVAGTRYICGEVSTLTIVVPASGVFDVTFESGSTATVLTITPPTGVTIKWIGADPTSLEANKTYEINIMDGELGMVIAWT